MDKGVVDLTIRNVDTDLQRRIERYARTKGWETATVLPLALRAGMQALELREASNFDTREDTVLAEAIKALEQVPDDPGFGLIGRPLPDPPLPDPSQT